MSSRPPAGAHEEMRDEVAAYAVGALDASDAAELEAHLGGCERCRAYLRWLQPAVDVLPESVRQLDPPESLRKSLLEIVGEDAASTTERPAARRVAPWRLGWWGAGWRPATAVAAVLALVAGGVIGYSVGDGEKASTEVAADPVGPGPADRMVATLERDGDAGTLVVERMPALPSDDVYEMWLARDGMMVAAGTFTLESDGTASTAVGGSLEGADAVLVTREPAGGSRQPTSAPLLRAELG